MIWRMAPRFGQAIWKSNRRVVIVASGGMSHKFWDYDHILDRASASPEEHRVNRQSFVPTNES